MLLSKNTIKQAVRFVVITLPLLMTGCEKLADNRPEAVFLCQYVNYAWGYQNSGFIIDTDGNLRNFNLPATWNYPDSDGFLSDSEMEENLAQLEEISCSVSNYDMEYYSRKLLKAQEGKITDPEHRMCDAGSRTWAGFLYEQGKNRYRYVFIRQWGDFFSENLSKDATDIYEWLEHPCNGNMGVRVP
jgi:hypothetical protein